MNNLEELSVKKTDIKFLPKNMYIGYMNSVSRQDLVEYIAEWTSDNFESRTSGCYQILPWNDGFIYEIQEGGQWLGALHSIVQLLKTKKSLIIQTGDKYLRIVANDSGVSTYILNEQGIDLEQEGITFADKMDPVFTRYRSVKHAGVFSACFGLMFLLGTWITADVVYKRNGVPVYPTATKVSPMLGLSQIDSLKKNEGQYIKSLEYRKEAWVKNVQPVGSATPSEVKEVKASPANDAKVPSLPTIPLPDDLLVGIRK